MNKTLPKAFMRRSKLKNNYKKFLKKEKKEYYNNLDLIIFYDNKRFWQQVRSLISEKQKGWQKEFVLIEKEKISDLEVTEKINYYFTEEIENLEIKPFLETCR